MPAQQKYIATITNVREVALLGQADLSYWQEGLRASPIRPAQRDGQALLMVGAISARYMGVRFRELCAALFVESADGNKTGQLFFVGAFNSSRMFTFFERNWFRTPYAHGKIEVSTEPAAAIVLAQAGRTLLRATMSRETAPDSAAMSAHHDHSWSGTIYLPAARGGRTVGQSCFNALIKGGTHGRPFDAKRDQFLIEPDSHDPVLEALRESGFVAREWMIRPNATHARTKTIRTGGLQHQPSAGNARIGRFFAFAGTRQPQIDRL